MILTEEKQKKVDEIAVKVCKYFGVSEQDIINKSWDESTSNARYFSWYFIHYKAGISAHKIATLYSRTSRGIFKGIAKIKTRVNKQQCYKRMFDDLANILDLI